MRTRTVLLAALLALGAAACSSDEAGYYSVSWSLMYRGAAVQCYDMSADSVEVLATHVTTGQGYSDLFDCMEYQGVTGDLPLGDYTVQVSLLDGGNLLASSNAFSAEPIRADGEIVSLTPILFSFQ